MVYSSPSYIIAKAMDAYRIRLWLTKGPRCPCRCGERIPWSVANTNAKITAFEMRMHIPTPRRPYEGACATEDAYIPSTLEGFRAYLVERRHIVRTYYEILWQRCLSAGQDWMIALLSNSHATLLLRKTNCPTRQTSTKVFDLVRLGWRDAATIMLSWPTTVATFNRYELNYLIRWRPCFVFYNRSRATLSCAERNWILHHPMMVTRTRVMRTHKNWMAVLLWTGVVKSWMRKCVQNKEPLPQPCMENIPALTLRIQTMQHGPRHEKDMLLWVAFLAKESPAVLRNLLPIIPVKAVHRMQWAADVVEAVATTGRVALLRHCLVVFQRQADMPMQMEKIWQWVNMPAFAIPRITRALLTMSIRVLEWAKEADEHQGLTRKLLNGIAILATIDRISVWLSNKMNDHTLLNISRKTRKCAAVAAALRATPRYLALQNCITFRATVYLSLFFNKYVRARKTRTINRGNCPICWVSKILQPLHGDTRHGICHCCIRKLERKNMLDRCPMCRTDL